jgi:CubicO group peptidase (beta-lactamase class C family)
MHDIIGKASLQVQGVARFPQAEAAGQETRHLDPLLDVEAMIDHRRIQLQLDLRLSVLRPDGRPRGQSFHYVSTNTDVLGWVYQRACGMSHAKILLQYLWQPMGAQHEA